MGEQYRRFEAECLVKVYATVPTRPGEPDEDCEDRAQEEIDGILNLSYRYEDGSEFDVEVIDYRAFGEADLG